MSTTNTSRVLRTSAGSTIAAATIESGCVVPGTPIERSNASALLVDLAVEARERRVDRLDAGQVVVEEHAVRERQRPREERDREARLEDDLRGLGIDDRS